VNSKRVDRFLRWFVPSAPRLSYSPTFRIFGNALSSALALPFPEFRRLPPNHLRVRVGVGNRIVNNQAFFLNFGAFFWNDLFANGYANAHSDIVDIGCGCGRLAMPLRQDFFKGTYLGIDIDAEMIEYCRTHFPPDRFSFKLAPRGNSVFGARHGVTGKAETFAVAPPESKDFVLACGLFTNVLEEELKFYMRESFKVLRSGGKVAMSFFCYDYVDKGGRWTFAHQVGAAHVENPKFPEAALAYTAAFLTDVARQSGFRDISVRPSPGLSMLFGQK